MTDTNTFRDGNSPHPKGRWLQRGVAIAGLLAVAGTGYGIWQHAHSPLANAAEAPSSVTAQPDPLPGSVAMAELPNFSGIVQRYGPAVVNIQVTGTMHVSHSLEMDPDNPLFRFFPRFGLPIPQDPSPSRGEGSGFIIGPDGVILTNAHVVDGADEVVVKLTDRREFKAKVLGVDKPSDVAVLKIDARDLPTVHLGRADPVRVGEWVLAIGSPFGFENSATAGIVSAKARALPDEGYVPFIQTDVAVNPGNSGGPLFNMNGDVVGINSQIYSRSGGYQGLSFAIPIDVAVRVKDQILQEGKVTRGRFGVTIQDMNQGLAQSFHLKSPAGALVSGVENGSPADKAGLKAGDVILELNGKPVQTSSELPPMVAALKPGSTATLSLWRDKDLRKVSIQVGELVQDASVDRDQGAQGGRVGLAVRPLTPEEQGQAEVQGGLLVMGVTGPAARAGVRDGDLILSVNGNPVRNVDELRRFADKTSKHIALLIQRGDAKLFVPIDLG